MSGSDWDLHEEGKAKGHQEPQFSTWEDVRNAKAQGSQQDRRKAAGSVQDETYYRFVISIYSHAR